MLYPGLKTQYPSLPLPGCLPDNTPCPLGLEPRVRQAGSQMCVPTSPAPPLDSLGGEEHKASVEEDHGEDDEERVAHSLLVCIVEHLTGLGGQQKGT